LILFGPRFHGASENGGNGLNGVDGAAAGTHGNGGNGKRIGPRLAIEESGEGTRSTNGGNEDQIESRVEFLIFFSVVAEIGINFRRRF
jgi:hypothetical protein